MCKNENMKEAVIRIFEEDPSLFAAFDSAYLFGSSLDAGRALYDVDLLLIYSSYSPQVGRSAAAIRSVLTGKLGAPVDLTVLSAAEAQSTQFLSRIRFLKLK